MEYTQMNLREKRPQFFIYLQIIHLWRLELVFEMAQNKRIKINKVLNPSNVCKAFILAARKAFHQNSIVECAWQTDEA